MRKSIMSHNITLSCGCVVYVACDPQTNIAHTRVIESRSPECRVRRHEVGLRLFLWELLPDRDGRLESVAVATSSRDASHC
jgi:hypothetical protein